MARPIPPRILRTTATVSVCIGVDRYQEQTYQDYVVNRVHLQPSNTVKKTVKNTDQVLRAILFVDLHHSQPVLDWNALFTQSHENAGDMRVTVRGVQYTVETVEELRDENDQLHHWEIGLV